MVTKKTIKYPFVVHHDPFMMVQWWMLLLFYPFIRDINSCTILCNKNSWREKFTLKLGTQTHWKGLWSRKITAHKVSAYERAMVENLQSKHPIFCILHLTKLNCCMWKGKEFGQYLWSQTLNSESDVRTLKTLNHKPLWNLNFFIQKPVLISH